MASHDEQFREHAVWAMLREAQELLARLPAESLHSGEERIATVVRHLDRWLDRAVPSLVPISQLDNLSHHLSQVNSQLQALLSSRDEQHLRNALSHTDGLLVAAQTIWSATSSDDVGSIREDVTNFRKSASQNVHNLSGEVDALRQELRHLGEARDAVRQEIEEQRGRLDSAIAEYQMQFSQAQEARTRDDEAARSSRQQDHEDTIRHARAGIDGIVRNAEEVRKSIRTTAEEQIDQARRSAEEQRAAQAAAGDEKLQALEELRQQAARVVGVVGNIGITGDYQKSAVQEKRQAFWWAVAALTFFLAAVLAAAYFLTVDTDSLGASGTARRIALSLIVGAPATFCVTQAREHRSAERRSRSLELELASLNPFIAELPEEYQQAMKADLSSRYFRGSDANADKIDVESWLQRLRRAPSNGQ